jgi:hypothetical protein
MADMIYDLNSSVPLYEERVTSPRNAEKSTTLLALDYIERGSKQQCHGRSIEESNPAP